VTLAEAHIVLQARLRGLTQNAVTSVWASLPAYNHQNVDEWLTKVLPIVTAAQRQSVHLTEAYLARALERQPVGVDVEKLIGDHVRNGAKPEDVYVRPFITTWSELKAGKELAAAVHAGLARATSTAATDVQLAMRASLVSIGQADGEILGYRRVPDAGACSFCQTVAGQRYLIQQLMPIHNHCGCGVEPITAANRGDFSGKHENDLSVVRDGVHAAVREHGELGPVLVDGTQHFTDEHALAVH
jgi:hypothetical protein